MAAFPDDRAALIGELERLEREYAALAEGSDRESWNRQAVPGKSWSVGQCLDHVAKINELYVEPLREAAARAPRGRQPLRANLLGRWFVAEMEPPAKRRLPAPAPAAPASDLDPATTVAAFRAAQRDIVSFVRDTAEFDLNRVRFRNPFLNGLRVFNVATGVLVIAAHERRHLLQAEKARQAALR
jgi:hypothetical protein